jgi:hypothetical protein
LGTSSLIGVELNSEFECETNFVLCKWLKMGLAKDEFP